VETKRAPNAFRLRFALVHLSIKEILRVKLSKEKAF